VRLTSKLNVISGITLSALVLLIPVFVWSVGESTQARADLDLVDQIENMFFERASLRDQYFLHSEDHIQRQWDENKQESDRLLSQARAQLSSHDNQLLVEQLGNTIDDTAVIFHRLTANRESFRAANGNREIQDELDKRLSSQLLLKASSLREGIITLHAATSQRVERAYQHLSAIVAVLTGTLALVTLLLTSSLVRLVRQRVLPLHDGAKRVAAGDLAFRLKSDGLDEFSELAESINAMTNTLAGEIGVRQQIEIKLRENEAHLESQVQQRTNQLMATEARASHLLEASADGLYGVDQAGKVTFINPAASAMLGYLPEQVIGQYAHNVFHHSKPDGSPYPIELCPSHNAVLQGLKMRKDSEVYWHADGHPIPVMFAIHPMYQDGVNSGAVISFVDISEQRAAALAQEKALIAAENLARVRSEFLANMSHEIRTPLNGVLGFAEIGHRHFMDAEKARNAFAKIIASGRLLLGVISEILDFSKIEAGKIRLEANEVVLAEVMDQARELVDERAHAKGLEIRIERSADLPRACITDALRLGQVLINLLSNAVKFTEHGTVKLSAVRDGNDLLFTVTDTGIGMNEEQLAQLFNPFHQADASTTRRFGGTGLGLAISKRLLELMGGSIRAESRMGEGSIFEFRVPYVPLTRAEVPPSREIAVVSISQGQPLAGMSILVVEDDEVNQMVIEANLIDDGAKVVMVSTGREATDRVLQDGCQAFDVVLMDIQMPEMDGYAATASIHVLVPELPIIGQTAHASSEDRERCLAAGMVDHITKPIDFDALARLLQQHARPRKSAHSMASSR